MKTARTILQELDLRRLELREWLEDASAATPVYREVCEHQAEVCRAKIELLEWILDEPGEEKR